MILENWTSEDINRLNIYLDSIKNVDKIDWTKKNINTNMPCLGIKMQVLRSVATEILKGNYISYLDFCNYKTYESSIINILIINKIKDFKTKEKYLTKHVNISDNWAMIDAISIKDIKSFNDDRHFSLAIKYIKSNKCFVRRAGIRILFAYIDINHIDKILKYISDMTDEKEYYVNMIISWFLCEAYIYYPDKVIEILVSNNLNEFVINKTISKCMDSYRISKEDKIKLKEYMCMKKILFILVTMFTCMLNIKAIDIKSNNAILYNLNDNSILYEKNINDKISIASLTKIVTAITIIDNEKDLNKEVTVDYNMLSGLDGYSKAGLKVGDKISYLDLLYALILPSGSDAAQVLAISNSGSIESFANLMNDEVEKIGVKNSHFDNPVGKDSDNNYSTVSDVSKILIYSLNNDVFKKIFETPTYNLSNLNIELKRTLMESEEKYNLDTKIIKGAKTGFTYDAGLCLASTSTIEDVNYLLVTCGAPTNYPYHIIDTLDIYNYFSSTYGYINILSKDQLIDKIKVKGSKIKEYDIKSNVDLDMYLEKTKTKKDFTYTYIGINELNKKIKVGDKLGIVEVKDKDKLLYTYDVYLDLDIKYYNYLLYISVAILSVVLIFIIFIIRKLNR